MNLDFIHKDAVKFATTDEIEHLLSNALAVANFILQSCQRKGWANLDTETLEVAGTGVRTLAKLRPN